MHEQFWERLAGLHREETAKRAKCRYLAECDSFAISLLNTEYIVDPVRRTIRVAAESREDRAAGYSQQLCILAYLVNARDLPSADRLVNVERLDPGGFFFRGSHRLPVEKLANVFGPVPQLLYQAGQVLNAAPRAFGDASIELLVLPRIPVTLVIWAADEEFPARASILFDQNATVQLPLDVLFATAVLTINVVLSIVGTVI
ncbi:MAG: hypothetical protein A2Y77_05185 [Planctomycetes bacterium RBG_13_62_9]|nr:MAG: hypothetical protein A2Y77_05185 [Planctomycetes bacterium RBG_13_62_9]